MSTKKEAFLGGFDGDYTAVHVEMQYPGFPEPDIPQLMWQIPPIHRLLLLAMG